MILRDFDWWKREGDLLIENWVPIDLIDLFAKLHAQVEHRKRGNV